MRFGTLTCLAISACLTSTLAPAITAQATKAKTSAATSADRDAVRRAVLDYLEGFYEGDTAKLVRALRPELFKYGFWKEKDSTRYVGEKMTYAEAIAYGVRFRAQHRTTPANAPRDVTLFEVQDQTASAKVRAWWGTDYVLLGKYDGRWMISQVLWQGP